MQVGNRDVDPSNPYKGGIRKKTWDEIVRRIVRLIVRRIFRLWKVNAIIPQNQNNKEESKQFIIVQIEALKNEHSVFVHFVYILTIAVQTTLNKIIHMLQKDINKPKNNSIFTIFKLWYDIAFITNVK